MTLVIDTKTLTQDTKLAELVRSDLNLLFVLNQFSMPMGFGDKTIGEICRSHGVDTESFLTLLMFHAQPDKPDKERLCHLDAATILTYLKNSHTYFLDYRLPAIKEQLAVALQAHATRSTILQYFDEYETEVKEHMNYENLVFFPYVESLLAGSEPVGYSVKDFQARHNNVDEALEELLSLLIKYLPTEGQYFLLSDALEAIKRCHRDLTLHTYLEDDILVPKIQLLEKHKVAETVKTVQEPNELSDREKEIVCSVAQGLSNKQIADKHFISIHTVITHRRNISRKLGIHSSAGLVVYAILNKLVTIDELRLNP
jgi:regulator of cell morphogenesis and NO signaling